jgi:hypothetical protein
MQRCTSRQGGKGENKVPNLHNEGPKFCKNGQVCYKFLPEVSLYN